jgi:hypothetical protein
VVEDLEDVLVIWVEVEAGKGGGDERERDVSWVGDDRVECSVDDEFEVVGDIVVVVVVHDAPIRKGA